MLISLVYIHFYSKVQPLTLRWSHLVGFEFITDVEADRPQSYQVQIE